MKRFLRSPASHTLPPAAALALLFAAFGLALPIPAAADGFSPVQIGIWEPIQIFDRDYSIVGIRLNPLRGTNRSVMGVDVGIWNQVEDDSWGFQLGLVNQTGQLNGSTSGDADAAAKGRLGGLQLGYVNGADTVWGLQLGLANLARQKVAGLQLGVVNGQKEVMGIAIGLLNGGSGHLRGVQLGLVNVSSIASGVQAGGSNLTTGEMRGVQLGVLNFSKSARGLQLGLVNVTESLSGVQIGLVNNVASRERWAYIPFINVSF
jgi:hypothetical protein